MHSKLTAVLSVLCVIAHHCVVDKVGNALVLVKIDTLLDILALSIGHTEGDVIVIDADGKVLGRAKGVVVPNDGKTTFDTITVNEDTRGIRFNIGETCSDHERDCEAITDLSCA